VLKGVNWDSRTSLHAVPQTGLIHIKNMDNHARQIKEVREISPSTQSSVDANAGSEH